MSEDRETTSWAPFFDAEACATFDAAIEQELQRRDVAYELAPGAVKVSLPGDTEVQLGLLNLAQLCNQFPPERWPHVIRDHFETTLMARSQTAAIDHEDFEEVRDLLKVRIYPRDYADEQSSIVARELSSELTMVLVYDLPTLVATVSAEHLEHWDLDIDDLFDLAMNNVARQDAVKIETTALPSGAEVAILYGESYFVATHALLLEQHFGPAPEHGIFIGVPTRHIVLFHAIEDVRMVQALNALLEICKARYDEGPGSISPTMHWLRTDDQGRRQLMPLPTEASPDPKQIVFAPPMELIELAQKMLG